MVDLIKMDNNDQVLKKILGQLTRIADALQAQQELAVEKESKMHSLLQATARMGLALENVKRNTPP